MSTEDNIKRLIGAADVETRADEAEWNQFARKAHGALFMRRAGIALGTVALIAVVAFAAVSLRPSSDTEPIPPAPAPSGTGEVTPEPTETKPSKVEIPLLERELWYVNGEKLVWGGMAMGWEISGEYADDSPSLQHAVAWFEILLGVLPGPMAEAGDTTAIPEGTELLGAELRGDVLYVDLSSEFESGGGSLSMQLRVAQIVFTGTQFSGIESVRIMIEGEEVDAIGGEGLIVSTPLTRRDFQDVSPNIVVETPEPGDQFSPGDTVAGFANVFEANVSINVVDAKGKVLFETFTTATCGSGCWGDFTQALDFALDKPQEGRINVLTYSAEDGTPQDHNSIPVMLVP